MNDFNDRVVIVTGGTRGIGAAVSKRFMDEGANVVAVYVGNDEAANAFKKSCAESGDRLELAKVDVSAYKDVEAFYGKLDKDYGRLDVLVNCAGIRRDGVVGMMKEEDWRRVLDVNLSGTFNMSKFAVRLMLLRKYGRIINITSPSGRIGIEGQANYAASKAGQVAFTKSLSKEVAKRKITVNCVSPGFIDTDLIAGLAEELRDAYKKMVPLKRFGTPEEIADAVVFLAGENASYITGTVLEVSGGL